MITRIHATAVAAALAALQMPVAGPASAQSPMLPFGPGEVLVYEARVAGMGRVGTGTLSITDTDSVRGREVYLLSFDFTAKVGPFEAAQRSDSWLDPQRLTALRFHKSEKKPLARDRSERVEIYPDERRWQAADGEAGTAPSSEPLDELSLLFYVRLLPLEPGREVRLERHFDPERNPVIVTTLGRETVEVPAGRFDAMVVEMRVRDPNRYRGEGRIRMHILEDDRRTPVRIETELPDAGLITLELATVSPAVLASGAGAATRTAAGSRAIAGSAGSDLDHRIGLFGRDACAAYIGGRIEVRSRFPEGTRVRAAIPVHHDSQPSHHA